MAALDIREDVVIKDIIEVPQPLVAISRLHSNMHQDTDHNFCRNYSYREVRLKLPSAWISSAVTYVRSDPSLYLMASRTFKRSSSVP